MDNFKHNSGKPRGRGSSRSSERGSYRDNDRQSGSFNRRDSGRDRFDRRDSGRDRFDRRDRPEMTTVTCDACSKTCEVPFKPSSDKPVYCSDCFRKDSRGGDSGSKSKDYSEELAEINKKLDFIIESMDVE
ncbi:hypothetical protein HN587_01715 [Candidatus Woesearchaeota archaeon]|mgnify:CR=1 FL=1|jgi:CxxC-x17-CxxC domain-containing protein|nr:hypothetical protein [Candidatus Woesearchaeota archaeon]